MNFSSKGWWMSLTLVVGGIPAFSAMMVTGNGTPADDFRPVDAARIRQFINSHQSKLSLDDITRFSAEIERNGYSVSAADTINASGQAIASNPPCPQGWTFNNQGTCFQNVESGLTNPKDSSDHYELDSSFAVDAQGNHAVYTSDDGIRYGIIYMRLVDPALNPALYVGQYEAYFFATAQDESTFVASTCGKLPVIYMTPPDTKPTDGFSFQVNVVNYVPDGSSSDNQTLSPYKDWATDLCPPSQASNN
jgi:hypothetical protein